jgi:anaerobic glycerol-3-phosphate dehydrogenase
MAGSIASLIVKIGADKSGLETVLAQAGQSAQTLDATLKKLGNTPLGQEAAKSAEKLERLKASLTSQQKLADRAKLAATGLEALGGPAKLTKDQLDSLNKTIQKGSTPSARSGRTRRRNCRKSPMR